MLKTLGSRVGTSVWTKFFVCLFVRLFVCLFGEGKERSRAFAGSALSECHFLVSILEFQFNCSQLRTFTASQVSQFSYFGLLLHEKGIKTLSDYVLVALGKFTVCITRRLHRLI